MSLAGVRKILDLEAELDAALDRIAELEEIVAALRRNHVRELVPVRELVSAVRPPDR